MGRLTLFFMAYPSSINLVHFRHKYYMFLLTLLKSHWWGIRKRRMGSSYEQKTLRHDIAPWLSTIVLIIVKMESRKTSTYALEDIIKLKLFIRDTLPYRTAHPIMFSGKYDVSWCAIGISCDMCIDFSARIYYLNRGIHISGKIDIRDTIHYN